MMVLPAALKRLLRPIESVFRESTWEYAMILLVGAILTPAKRTVTAALSVMGLRHDPQFQNDHRVLNRASWSCHALSRILLTMLLNAFVSPTAAVVFCLDETIERHWGAHIAARGIYRDPVRSSQSHFVKTSGLRWMSMMLLATIPWAQRVWALPFLTVLAPSERYYHERGRPHKPILVWAQHMITQLRRWLPNRILVVVADSSYAALELLAHCARMRPPVTLVTRLRVGGGLDPAPVCVRREPGDAHARKGRASRPWRSATPTHPRSGRPSPGRGMAAHCAPSASPPARRSGITVANRPSPSAGC